VYLGGHDFGFSSFNYDVFCPEIACNLVFDYNLVPSWLQKGCVHKNRSFGIIQYYVYHFLGHILLLRESCGVKLLREIDEAGVIKPIRNIFQEAFAPVFRISLLH